NIIIGKAHRYFKHSNTVSITYWSTNIDTLQSQLYPLSPISCMPCPEFNQTSSLTLMDLILPTAIKHPLTIPIPSTLNISDYLVSDLFLSNETSQLLQLFAQKQL
ncbi:21979_t:CDS:2, partial [Gigaspora margarita]